MHTRASISSLQPSAIDSGYILSVSRLRNPFLSDSAYQRILDWYLPADVIEILKPRLIDFGHEAVSDQINAHISNAEKQQPYVKSRDVWGNLYPYDRLVTSEGWKQLGKWGISNGVVAIGYEEEFGCHRRVVQHAFNYIYSASSAVYSCPVSMTSGAARLFAHQLPSLPSDHPFHEVYKKLIARKDSLISSQWMTERPGGSDVQTSETVAVYSPLPNDQRTGRYKFGEGDWLVSGYKFFCSATDCDIALMLAKTESGQLSLFAAPTKRLVKGPDGDGHVVTNGIRFHRLKNKMGTKELPTAELELKNVRAWMVGSVDRGVATIATLLNVTRTHNFITALSCWRRGMAIAKNFAQARTTINQPLRYFPMHLRLLAGMEVRFQGLLQMAFFTTAMLSYVDNGFPQQRTPTSAPLPRQGEEAKIVLRTYTATAKAVICKLSSMALQECQEAMGGVGYMDEPDEPEFNISRLYRDNVAQVTWEGTVNVLSSEVIRHLMKGNHLQVFHGWLQRSISAITDDQLRSKLDAAWSVLHRRFAENEGLVYLLADGRQLMFSLAWTTCGVLLAHDSQRDADPVACEIAKRWILDGVGGVGEFAAPDVVHAGASTARQIGALDRLNWDCRLVWDEDWPRDAASGFRPSSGSAESVIRATPKL